MHGHGADLLRIILIQKKNTEVKRSTVIVTIQIGWKTELHKLLNLTRQTLSKYQIYHRFSCQTFRPRPYLGNVA
jgi:hypothetical protein